MQNIQLNLIDQENLVISDTSNDFFHLHNRRYIGNKHKLNEWIFSIIQQECSGESFADIFAGTGSVGSFSSKYFKKVILNDILYSNYIIYKAFFKKGNWNLRRLKSIVYNYNSINPDNLDENYFSKYFGKKYFSKSDAKIIGYIREDIEINKKLLTTKEYDMLLASLIYSTDKIANTVGHYDAYFKKSSIKDRFLMKLVNPVDISNLSIYRADANTLAKNIKADVTYIDPPYNSRQYSRFYHVLETLTKWDSPKLFGVALKPKQENMSDYCKIGATNRFKELVKDVNSKYLVTSYNNTYTSKSSSSKNKISLEELKDILSSKGQTKIFEKEYRYFNTGKTNFNNHKEYLFVTCVNKKKTIKRSPLFYVGDKYKLMNQLKSLFPKKINNFYEPFVGGGTVFLNIDAQNYFLNDINEHLIKIHNLLFSSSSDTGKFFNDVEKIIVKYNLSQSYKKDIVPKDLKKAFKKTYYARFNKEGYKELREKFNSTNNSLLLYLLLIYGFNRMLRFNRDGDFNLPVGNVDFNQNVVNSLNDYFDFVESRKIKFSDQDFKDFLSKCSFKQNDFIYFDPPYLITDSEYNKIWNEDSERKLLSLIDKLHKKNVKFALSNVTVYKGDRNHLLIKWMKKYNVHKIKSNYINYHNNTQKNIKEILITNY